MVEWGIEGSKEREENAIEGVIDGWGHVIRAGGDEMWRKIEEEIEGRERDIQINTMLETISREVIGISVESFSI